jgi:hypothetical protein
MNCVPNAVELPLSPPSSIRDASGVESTPGRKLAPTQTLLNALFRFCNRIWKVAKTRGAARQHLRVCETVSLGEKRFVAVVQVDRERFLVGGAANCIAMLARLAEPVSFPPINLEEHSEGVRDGQ